MAKSRKDPKRVAKVADYKEKQKVKNKRMEVPKFKPFRQVPHWEPDAQISLTGSEFSMLQNFFNVFAEPINIMQDIFSRNLNSGTITVKYVDNDGNEMSKEEVQAYMQEVQNYLKAQAEQNQGVVVPVTEEAATEALTTTETDTDTLEVVATATEPEEKPKRKLKVVQD